MAVPHHIVVIVGSLRKDGFTLKIAKALAKLAPEALKLEVASLHGISFFNQDLEVGTAGRLGRLPRKAPEVRRRPVRHRRIQPFDSRRAQECHRCRIASLRQELVPRQAGRHRQQLAGTARWRQRRQTFAEILPGICGPIMGQPEIYLNGVGDAFDDKGKLVKESLRTVLKQYIDAYAAFVGRHYRYAEPAALGFR